jgi:hypothetical protein
MPDRSTREHGTFRRGSERGRKLFSLFGIRAASADDEDDRSEDAEISTDE